MIDIIINFRCYYRDQPEEQYTLVNGVKDGFAQKWYKDGSFEESLEFFRDGKLINFQVLAKERLAIYKEELIANVYHPDRLERMAKHYNMNAEDYLDLLD